MIKLAKARPIDSIILEHEQAKLKQLKLDHTEAVREYLLAMGKMQTAKSDRASLEIRTTDLLAAKAELERQQEEEKLEIEDEVLNLLLDYEAANRKLELLTTDIEPRNFRTAEGSNENCLQDG